MNISFINVVMFLIPVFLIIFALYIFKITILKRSLWAITRMIIQLALVGIYLKYIFEYNNWIINYAYILIMVLAASSSILGTVKLSYKKFYVVISCSVLLSWGVTYGLYQLIILKHSIFLSSRYIIPISGMLLGNLLKGQIIFLNNFFQQLRDNENLYFSLLSLGATKFEALKEFYKNAIIIPLNSDLASMTTIGVVSLPGMMTGQILSGISPITAIKYQISIMLAIYFIKIFSLITLAFILNYTAFDQYSLLKKNIFRDK